MRLLIVTPLIPPEPGGPSYYSVALKSALERAGHGADLIAFQEVRSYPSGLRHLMFLYKVLFRALKADTLIVLDTVSVALPAVVAGWLLGKKVIIRTGGDFVWEAYVERTGEKVKLSEFYTQSRTLMRKERTLIWVQKNIVFRLATMIVFSTAWQRDIWREPYKIPESKTSVIENVHGATPPLPPPPPSAPPPQAGGGVVRHTFLWAGRDLVLKNVDTLKRAFEKVRETYPAMELKLLTGVPREEVEREMKKARCFVLPSVSEVSPNVVYEALSFGVPVICTSDAGICAEAPAGVVFVDTLDEQALAEAMLEMCDEKRYGEVAANLTQSKSPRTYDDVAEEILALVVGRKD